MESKFILYCKYMLKIPKYIYYKILAYSSSRFRKGYLNLPDYAGYNTKIIISSNSTLPISYDIFRYYLNNYSYDSQLTIICNSIYKYLLNDTDINYIIQNKHKHHKNLIKLGYEFNKVYSLNYSDKKERYLISDINLIICISLNTGEIFDYVNSIRKFNETELTDIIRSSFVYKNIKLIDYIYKNHNYIFEYKSIQVLSTTFKYKIYDVKIDFAYRVLGILCSEKLKKIEKLGDLPAITRLIISVCDTIENKKILKYLNIENLNKERRGYGNRKYNN